MARTGALPAANAAPLAHGIDSQELFRGSRLTADPGVNAYRSQNLWLKWSGRFVVDARWRSFFHALNMDRHLSADGRKRPTDFGGRGRQRVVTHLYVDGVKLDSKDKRFSEIEGSLRTQFGVQLAPGLHSIELWMGVVPRRLRTSTMRCP